MKAYLLPILALVPIFSHADNVQHETVIGAGYRFEVSDRSDNSNQFDKLVISARHSIKTQRVNANFIIKLENPGQLEKNDVKGGNAAVSTKIIGDTYYHIDNGVELWWHFFSNSNQVVSEVVNGLGLAYKAQIYQFRIKIGAHAAYTVAHGPTAKFEGFSHLGSRLNISYPLTHNIDWFSVLQSRWGRDDAYRQTHQWDKKDGHQITSGFKYVHDKNNQLTLAYQIFEDWGGYKHGGNAIDLSYSYKF